MGLPRFTDSSEFTRRENAIRKMIVKKKNEIEDLRRQLRDVANDRHGSLWLSSKARIKSILAMRAEGKTYEEIARVFATSRQRIHQIVKRETVDEEVLDSL